MKKFFNYFSELRIKLLYSHPIHVDNVIVIKELNNIPQINAGGCGIAALGIYRFLRKCGYAVGKRYKIILLHNSINRFKIDLINVKYNNYRDLEAVPHVCIYDVLNKKYIDSYGVTAAYDDRYMIVLNSNAEKILLYIINEKIDSWCDHFQRKNIKLIEDILGVSLNDVKINEEE